MRTSLAWLQVAKAFKKQVSSRFNQTFYTEGRVLYLSGWLGSTVDP